MTTILKKFEFYDFDAEVWRPFDGHLIKSKVQRIPLSDEAQEAIRVKGEPDNWFLCWLAFPPQTVTGMVTKWTLCREVALGETQ